MSRIFISYKRVNKEPVFRIKDHIEKATGEECWVDLDGIESDAQFAEVIINAIDRCEVFLFMYSAAHLEITDLEQDWTVRELQYASMEKKRIVFVNIDGSQLGKWFKFMFGQKQQVDATSPEPLDKLCTELIKWLGIKAPGAAGQESDVHAGSASKTKPMGDSGKIVRKVECNGCHSALIVKYTPGEGKDSVAKCPKCGNTITINKIEGDYLPIGYRLNDRYYIRRVIAAGGFGVIYEAEDSVTNETVAIKEFFMRHYQYRDMLTLKPLSGPAPSFRSSDTTTLFTNSGYLEFSDYLQRFRHEASLINGLSHPCIVNIRDVFDANGTAYYVMDYINGNTLYAIRNRQILTPEQLYAYLFNLSSAIEYMHAQGVVHGDIAPQNVIITSDNKTKLIDFGLAQVKKNNKTSIIAIGHREGYSPLECYSSEAVLTPQSDVYSFGALMYYLFTGSQPPHPFKLLDGDVKEYLSGYRIPGPVKALICTAMSRQPYKRPSMKLVSETLHKLLRKD